MVKPNSISISKSWGKIFPDSKEEECLSSEEEKFSVATLAAIFRNTSDCENVDSGTILKWFAVEYQIMSLGAG
jgi:hypothetical protein